MFQKDIHIFRAIAILIIVGGHTRLVLTWASQRELGNLLADFLANGTVLFVFVAGYLFQALSHKYLYGDYIVKKFKNVVLPYMIVSAPAVLLAVFYYEAAAEYPFLEGRSITYQVLWFYVKGGAHLNYPLWFIPMISLFYLLAPVFAFIVRYPWLYLLLLPLFVLSVLIHRAPSPHLDTLHLALYFVAPYVAGMATSQFREKVNAVIEGRLLLLVLLYAAVLVAHFLLAPKHGVHAAQTWFSTEQGVFDWPFVQKMLMCFVLLELGRTYQDVLYPKLKYIADISFGLYFVHAYFLTLIAVGVPKDWRQGSLLSFAIAFAAVMFLGTMSCYVTQKLTGRYSRTLIGC